MQYLLDENEHEVYKRLKEDKEITLKALKQLLLDIDNDDTNKSSYLADKETCEYVLGLRDDRPLFDRRRESRKKNREE
jgi:hypothetical protein